MPFLWNEYWWCNHCQRSFVGRDEASHHEQTCMQSTMHPPARPQFETMMQQPQHPVRQMHTTRIQERSLVFGNRDQCNHFELSEGDCVPCLNVEIFQVVDSNTQLAEQQWAQNTPVGLRCRYCRGGHPRGGGGAVGGSVVYPQSVQRVWEALQQISHQHLAYCPQVPPAIREAAMHAWMLEQNAVQSGGHAWNDRQRTRQSLWRYCTYRCWELQLIDRFPGNVGIIFYVPEVSLETRLQAAINHLERTRISSNTITSNTEDLLVLPTDRELLTDYVFYAIHQFHKCRLTVPDKDVRGREGLSIGFGGFLCRHCQHLPTGRKFFWRQKKTLENSSFEFLNHALNCTSSPQETRDALAVLKSIHPSQMSSSPRGSQATFFQRMWHRIHSHEQDRLSEEVGSLGQASVPSWTEDDITDPWGTLGVGAPPGVDDNNDKEQEEWTTSAVPSSKP